MTDRREFARRQAEAFTSRTLSAIGELLADHSAAVVDHAVDVHARLDAAEALLREVAEAQNDGISSTGEVTWLRLPTGLNERIRDHVADMEARRE